MQERNYGIDLLRLVLMYMVCMMHTLGQGRILDGSAAGTAEYRAFWFLEIFSYCAVDGFAIISGYTAGNTPRKYSKIVDMWFQAFFYSFVLTIAFTLMGLNENPVTYDFIKSALPVTSGIFWYFTAYFALFFAIPFLNQRIFSMNELTAKKSFIGLFVLYSVLGIAGDPFELQWGYSALWLMVLYCMGALARQIKLFESRRAGVLILLWIACVVFTWAVHVFLGIEALTKYVSPPVLMCAILMVVLFSRLRLKGRILARLTPLVFGVYLFQLNPVIWNSVMKYAFLFVSSENIFIEVMDVCIFALSIFIVALSVEFVRIKLAQALKISRLSNFIVTKADKLIMKFVVFLK